MSMRRFGKDARISIYTYMHICLNVLVLMVYPRINKSSIKNENNKNKIRKSAIGRKSLIAQLLLENKKSVQYITDIYF